MVEVGGVMAPHDLHTAPSLVVALATRHLLNLSHRIQNVTNFIRFYFQPLCFLLIGNSDETANWQAFTS